MRNSTGSPLFSDFKSDLSRVVRSRPLVKGNEDAGYEGGTRFVRLDSEHAQSDGKSVNRGLPVLDLARGSARGGQRS